MKDRFLAAYLKDFTDDFGLAEFDENELFEHFVNYSIISKHHPESFQPEDVAVGGSGDLGIDGLAIVVNDHLVTSTSDVDYLKKVLRRPRCGLHLHSSQKFFSFPCRGDRRGLLRNPSILRAKRTQRRQYPNPRASFG